ncbi:hypothetical protein Bca52824_055716 [Brassica carinata]|uniref:Reverse transcriptase n=1 Tax=Brassica carinata TaxID=52824 RepID=A0A8X7UQ97_BRACI|nr:hypothetical protein Bca52824_055716 [Brassica carinata]
MASAIRAGTAGRWNAENILMAESEDANFGGIFMASSGSTVFSTGFSEPCASSGTVRQKIIQAWRGSLSSHGNRRVVKRLRDCRGVLSQWKKERQFNAKDRIHLLERRLEWFQSRNYPCWHAIRVIRRELASENQARVLQDILKVYGAATGHTINLQKSAISFGVQVNAVTKNTIREVKLSQGGKKVLLKSTAAALPVYPMSVFKLPKTICVNLSSAMADFWWGSDAHKKKIHWIAWDKLCLPKESGGMGFRDLEAFNQALLAKQAWKVLSSPHCLLAQFFKSRYFPNSSFLDAKLGERPSYAWRSLLFGRDLLIKGLQRRVGDGNSIRVWTDKWIEDDTDGYGPRAPWIKNCTFDVNLRARSLIDFQNRRWNVQALKEIFVPSDVQILLKHQPVTVKEDFWNWRFNKSGAYMVKSGYWLATKENNLENQKVEMRLSRVFPWLLWYLWKNRNGFLFEGKLFEAREVVKKAKDEADS